MPPAIAAIGVGAALGAASAAIAGATAAGILAAAAIGGALSGLSALLAPKPPKLDLGTQRADTRHTVFSAVSPARWVPGRALVGGVMVYYGEANDGRTVRMAFVISEGACDAIERVWVDGDEVPMERTLSAAGNGEYILRPPAGNRYRGKISVTEYFAADGTQGAGLRNRVSDWTAEHKLEGVSWVHVRLDQPNYGNDIDKRFWHRLPEINFLVRGLKFTWPGQATPAWTDNAAAIRYWWLRTRRGIPDAAIDHASVRAAVSLCGAQVTADLPEGYDDYATTSARYAVNGVIHADDDPEQVEAELDFAWQGWVVETAGVHHFRPGADRPIARTVTPDDIIETGEVQPLTAVHS